MDSISVIIPTYNEELNIKMAVKTITGIVSRIVNDYELLIVNDGSADATAKILRDLTQKDDRIKVISHPTNKGIGEAFRSGIRAASKTYITGFPADIDFSLETYKHLLLARKRNYFVSSFVTNMYDREVTRQITSIVFTAMMNFIFRLKLKYYNGYFICPSGILKNMPLKSTGFTIFAEIKIRAIYDHVPFTEIPFETRLRQRGVSKALSWMTIAKTLWFLPALIGDIYLNSNYRKRYKE